VRDAGEPLRRRFVAYWMVGINRSDTSKLAGGGLHADAGGQSRDGVVGEHMLIEGGLVVGYLTAAIARGGQRLADRTLDSLLDRLSALVVGRMGSGPLDRLAGNPHDERSQREVGLTIDGAVSVDRAFAHELADLVAKLDRQGGRQMLNQVYAQMNVQAFDHGTAIGGNFNYFNAPDPTDYSGAPAWIKLFIVVGTLAAVAGLGIFGYTLFTDMPDLNDPSFGEMPAGFGVAAAVFFAGFVILGIASLGRGLSRRR
jgi:hypothetical protein